MPFVAGGCLLCFNFFYGSRLTSLGGFNPTIPWLHHLGSVAARDGKLPVQYLPAIECNNKFKPCFVICSYATGRPHTVAYEPPSSISQLSAPLPTLDAIIVQPPGNVISHPARNTHNIISAAVRWRIESIYLAAHFMKLPHWPWYFAEALFPTWALAWRKVVGLRWIVPVLLLRWQHKLWMSHRSSSRTYQYLGAIWWWWKLRWWWWQSS